MSAGWRKYGGVNQMNESKNVSVYSIVSDTLTLRQGYYGAFDVCGELHVSDTARFDGLIKGKNLNIKEDISANRLYVGNITANGEVKITGNLQVSGGDVFLLDNLDICGNVYVGDVLYLGNTRTAYLYGTDITGNIGINTISPIATLDVSSSIPFALNVANTRGNAVYGAFQTQDKHSIVLRVTEPAAEIGFYVDTPLNPSAQIPDGKIEYTRGGILNIDVSDNTNILSRVTMTNRTDTNTNHIMDETVAIYDISAGPYLPDVYDNLDANTGNALSLITNDSSANTFLHIVTPDKRGLSIGGGAYSVLNETDRAMGTIGLQDASVYTPAINIVSGSSKTHRKMTVGINTHAPRVDGYSLDINGPVHINNGEVSVIYTTDFEIIRFVVGVDINTKVAIAVGTPHTVNQPYKQQFLFTKDQGETWTKYIPDFGNVGYETNGITVRDAYVVDSSFMLVVGDSGFTFYSVFDNANFIWQSITQDPSRVDIVATYVHNDENIKNRTFFGYSDKITWTDLGNDPYTDIDGFPAIIRGVIQLNGAGLADITGYGNTLWIVRSNKIMKRDNISSLSSGNSSAVSVYEYFPENNPYTKIYVLDDNTVCAIGDDHITFTHNAGTTWTDVSGLSANSICLLDASNAIIVGANGTMLYSTDGYHTWNAVPFEQLNNSGNAERLLDSRYNLTNISFLDNATFYVTQTTVPYNSTINPKTIGQSRIFYLYLPNLFQNTQNYVLDISGSTCISGDMKITQGGRILSDMDTFHLLDENVKNLYVGSETSNVYVGGKQGTVYLNNRLDVSGNTLLRDQLNVVNDAYFQSNITVDQESFLNANVFVGKNIDVSGNATVRANLNVKYDGLVERDFTVNRNTFVLGETELRGNLLGKQNSTIYGQSDICGNLQTYSNLIVQQNAHLNSNVFVKKHIVIDGNAIVHTDLQVDQNANINGNLNVALDGTVNRTFIVKGETELRGNLIVQQNAYLNSNVFVKKHIEIDGNAIVRTDLQVDQNTNIDGNLTVQLDGTVNRTFIVKGETELRGNLVGKQNSTIYGQSDICGNLQTYSNLIVQQNTYLNGNVFVKNHIEIKGNAIVRTDLQVDQNANIDGNLNVKLDGTIRDLTVNRTFTINGETEFGGNLVGKKNSTIYGQSDICGNLQTYSNLIVKQNAYLNSDVFIGKHIDICGNAIVRTDLQAKCDAIIDGNLTVKTNGNVIGLFTAGNLSILNETNTYGNVTLRGSQLTVNGNARIEQVLTVTNDTYLNANVIANKLTVSNNMGVTGNATIYKSLDVCANIITNGLTVSQNATVNSNLDVCANIITRRLTVNADSDVYGNVNAHKNIIVDNVVYSNRYDSIGNTISLGISGTNTSYIKIGNFFQGAAPHVIKLGAPGDIVEFQGNTTQATNVTTEAKIIYLNKGGLNGTGSGAGIAIEEEGNQTKGFLLVSSDNLGFSFKAPGSVNQVKLDINNITLPASFTAGLLGITANSGEYSLSTSAIDPYNIVLKNKTLSSTEQQIIDSTFSVIGKMSVGTSTFGTNDTNCALVVNGNVQNTNGYIWQF